MLLILILTRLALSAVFGVAGVAKLLDHRGTREALLNFGVPRSLTASLSILLPLSELVVALAFLSGGATRWAALAALLLLFIFIAVIGINLRRGRAPECHCFGQLYSRPLGWPTLLRNIAFAMLAGIVFWQAPVGADPGLWLLLKNFNAGHSRLAVGGYATALLTGALMLLFYLQQARSKANSRQQERPAPAGLPVDSVAPAFELMAYTGGSCSLAQLLPYGKPVILIFANPNCGPCVTLFREVGQWQRLHHTQMTLVIVSQGSVKENFVNTVRNDLRNVLLQQQREVADVYQAKLTPTAVVVRADGRIGSKLAAGADEIRNLVQNTIASTHHEMATD